MQDNKQITQNVDSFNRKKSATQLIVIDPRTKILALLVINMMIMTIFDNRVVAVCFAVCGIFLMLVNAWKYLIATILIFVGCAFLSEVILPQFPNPVVASLAIAGLILSKFLVVAGMGIYCVKSTKPAEFIVAARRLHLPEAFTIPLAVMFRFFPSVADELKSISDAMKLRNLSLGGWSFMAHPIRTAEHVMVPLLISTVRTGEELTASALTRGLGSPGPVTTVHRIGFGVGDILGLVLIAVVIGTFLLTRFI